MLAWGTICVSTLQLYACKRLTQVVQCRTKYTDGHDSCCCSQTQVA